MPLSPVGEPLHRCPYCGRAANAETRRSASRGMVLVKRDQPVELPLYGDARLAKADRRRATK